MPRPRKPTRILELTGRLRHDKKRFRDRAHEPVHNAPLGDPPAHLEPTAQGIWLELRGQLVDGVALASDRAAFETLVRLVAKDRRGGLEGSALGTMVKLYTLFGMTPADRSRVSAPRKAGHGNPFANLG